MPRSEHDRVDEKDQTEALASKPKDDEAERQRGQMTWNQAVVVGGLAVSLPGMLFGPPLFGMVLDDYFGTAPWLTLGLLVMGFAATVYNIFLILRRVKLMN